MHNVVLQDLSSFPTLRIPFFEETNTTAGHGNENVLYLKTLAHYMRYVGRLHRRLENIGKSAIDA